jgi:hypothetical protein
MQSRRHTIVILSQLSFFYLLFTIIAIDKDMHSVFISVCVYRILLCFAFKLYFISLQKTFLLISKCIDKGTATQ